jgi:hypothetical protein
MRLAGHLDRCDAEGLGGWVVDLDEPQTAVALKIYVGDRFIGTSVANQFRQDLANAKINNGQGAFRVTFNEKLDSSDLKNIEVKIGASSYSFSFFHRQPFSQPMRSDDYQASPRKKRFDLCVLHIGTEKTGSTSIQAMLANNRRVLADAGYFLPLTLCQTKEKDDGNHSHITAMAMRDDAFDDDLRGRWGIKTIESLQSYRVAQVKLFEDEIAEKPGNCDKLLLSNEHCHSRLLTIQEVSNVKALLEPHCEKFKIIVYLRPQFELALSQYGMMVLNGYYDIEALPPLPYPADYPKRRYTNELYFNYEQLLNRWATVFGKKAIEPRLYAAGGPSKKSPTTDFLEVLDVQESVFRQPARENTNISAAAQEFLIKLYSEFSARGYSPSDSWASPIRALMRSQHPGSGYKPARGEIIAFQQRFEKSNTSVKMNWFPDRDSLFDEDYTRYPEQQLSALDDRTTFSLFADVIIAGLKSK